MVVWCALIALNQLWRAALVHAYRRIRPGADAAPRWGRYWATGSALAGSLWGAAGVTMFPEAPAHQALLIVCLFGAALGGLNLTAVYKPSFYGFVLPALVPLIVRVALVGDPVHFLIAGVTSVVLAFVIGFGHQLNDVLTRSLVIRYENVDLIDELQTSYAERGRRARRRRIGEPREEPVAGRREPRSAPTAARARPLCRRAVGTRSGSRMAAAGRSRRIRRRRARNAVRAIDRPVAPRCRRAGARARAHAARRHCSRGYAPSSARRRQRAD